MNINSNNLPALQNPLTYRQYASPLDMLAATGKTTGPEQTEEKINYTKLNAARSRRVHNQFQLQEPLQDVLLRIPVKWNWLVLTEAWCGDSGQLLPAIAEISEAASAIALTILLRDENPELMDQYLTNGGRAIPKLICLDASTGETLFTWGPRPDEIRLKVLEFKMNNPEATKEDLHTQLAVWYAKDKSAALQHDLTGLISETLHQTETNSQLLTEIVL